MAAPLERTGTFSRARLYHDLTRPLGRSTQAGVQGALLQAFHELGHERQIKSIDRVAREMIIRIRNNAVSATSSPNQRGLSGSALLLRD